LWACHFALNILWAPIFFGLQRLRLGLVVNGLLVGTLLSAIKLFFEMDPVSTYLLVPYLGWLLFATYLNYAICKRNPTNQGYNNAMLEADIIKLQKQAAKYADGL
jgi:tryptophan-rich sensory protein